MKTNVLILSLVLLLNFEGLANGNKLDAYGGFKNVFGKKTGFFHTEKIDGRWWLITPEGHGFFGIGISNPFTHFSQGAVIFGYGNNQEAWLRDGIKKMRELGYNCAWSGPYSTERNFKGYVDLELARRVYREEKIPHGLHIPLILHPVERPVGTIRPDVFSDEYKAYVKTEVEKLVPQYADEPLLLGYYYGFGCFIFIYDWLNETLGRKPGSPGREHLLNILEGRYKGDIQALNSVYNTDFESFEILQQSGTVTYPLNWQVDRLYEIQNEPDREKRKMMADAEALLGEIVEQIYKLAEVEIRKYDQNHMLLGGFVKDYTFTDGIWKKLAPYVDVLTPQEREMNFIHPIVESTGVPAMLSDQEYGNVYPLPVQTRGGAWGAIPDYIDRRVLYDLLGDRIAKEPGYIGVSFCACFFDNSNWVKPYERGQPGFFTVDGIPRHDLCDAASTVNARMLDTVNTPLDRRSLDRMDEHIHKTREAYQLVMSRRYDYLEKEKKKHD